MIHLEDKNRLYKHILESIEGDIDILDDLRSDVRILKSDLRRIQPRSTTALSLVGTDGGNNRIDFNPFSIQLVRVVDSSNNEYWLDAVTPSSDITHIEKAQFDQDGNPQSSLGEMMFDLNVRKITKLSHMIRLDDSGRATSSSWLQVYRELVEWAVLYSIVKNKDFATDTIIVHDGLLRSKVFSKNLFSLLLNKIDEAIRNHWKRSKRNIYVVGLAKHSKVLTKYRLAMALEQVFTVHYPSYVEIPRDLEIKSYKWSEFARGVDIEEEGKELAKFVGGKMFFVKFGRMPSDPIWPVDLLISQKDKASVIISSLLADAVDGFPVPFYPRCLQKAHENAALVDFDFEVLQDGIFEAIRSSIDDPSVIDAFRLIDNDPAKARYS